MTPARQMVPIVLVWGFYAAYFLQETDFLKTRLFKAAAGISVFISYMLMVVPALRYTSAKEKVYTLFSKSQFNFLWLFPSFRDTISIAQITIVLLYVAVIIGLFFRYSRVITRTRERK